MQYSSYEIFQRLNKVLIVIFAEEELASFGAKIGLRVWKIVALVLAASYTASFASMLTVQQLSPTATDVHELQKNGDYVGFHQGSFIEGLLLDIGFHTSKIDPYQ